MRLKKCSFFFPHALAQYDSYNDGCECARARARARARVCVCVRTFHAYMFARSAYSRLRLSASGLACFV